MPGYVLAVLRLSDCCVLAESAASECTHKPVQRHSPTDTSATRRDAGRTVKAKTALSTPALPRTRPAKGRSTALTLHIFIYRRYIDS